MVVSEVVRPEVTLRRGWRPASPSLAKCRSAVTLVPTPLTKSEAAFALYCTTSVMRDTGHDFSGYVFVAQRVPKYCLGGTLTVLLP